MVNPNQPEPELQTSEAREAAGATWQRIVVLKASTEARINSWFRTLVERLAARGREPVLCCIGTPADTKPPSERSEGRDYALDLAGVAHTSGADSTHCAIAWSQTR